MIIAEILWLSLYCLTILFGVTLDDLNLFTLSFFLLALAGLEFCIGFLLVTLFRYFTKTLDLNNSKKKNENTEYSNTFVKRYTLI